MQLLHPEALLLLLWCPFWLYWKKRNAHRRKALPISTLAWFPKHTNLRLRLRQLSEWTGLLVFGFLVLALARPQRIIRAWPQWGKGIDVMIALDTSTSMLQKDFRPNRLNASRAMLQHFIRSRRQQNDRLGLVLFAKRAFTLCPLTTDHEMLLRMLSNTEAGVIADATALGDAIATSLARLRHTKAKQKAIILVTDGENNAGTSHPLVAAKLANHHKVRVYPLLVGRPTPQADRSPQSPWTLMQTIASLSQGRAFRVQQQVDFQRSLTGLLARIAPSRAKQPRYLTRHTELAPPLLWIALGILLLHGLARLTWLGELH